MTETPVTSVILFQEMLHTRVKHHLARFHDERGHIKKHGKRRLTWKNSKGYLATKRRIAAKERKLAAHRKSLHGRLVHQIIRRGNTIRTEKLSYKAWQKLYGKSVGRNAPGMFLEHLRRTGASHRRHPERVPYEHHQAVPILPWLPELCQEATLRALASLRLRHRPGAA